MLRIDRRESQRVKHPLKVSLKIRETISKKPFVFEGESIEISPFGLSISTDKILPSDNNKGLIEIQLPHSSKLVKARMIVQWRNDEKNVYGIKFSNSLENQLDEWDHFISSSSSVIQDRRIQKTNRRAEFNSLEKIPLKENRKKSRRIYDLWNEETRERNDKSTLSKTDLLPKHKNDYTKESAQNKREWLTAKTGVKLQHVSVFSEEPHNFKGNIENFIGVTQVPIGITGPLKVNGEYANGNFYVPMATTEGAIVYTYSLGMQLATLSGGINTRILKDETHISPLFTFDNLNLTNQFCNWLQSSFPLIKKYAERTTKYGILLRIEPIIFDKNVIVKFCYKTGDAMGLNMINFATEAACNFINPIVKPKRFYLRSNFSSIKKVSSHNYSVGMGKTVVCDIVIPAQIVKRFFETTPQKIVTYFNTVILSSSHAGMISINGHTANGLTAIFIACGQDVASIVDSHIGISNSEVTPDGDLYVSLKMPNLVIGTVGGGTSLGSQRECLEILGCYGSGKVGKFAEIIAASALCGEIAIGGSITTGKFVEAHKTFGRKIPFINPT